MKWNKEKSIQFCPK